jgi:hypothetical protein
MTDDTIETEKPVASAEQSQTFKNFSQAQPDPVKEPKPEPEITATEHLAAAEDKLLGPDVSRHDGKPEKGIGSRHHALHPAHKAHLAAIEHLIVVEAEHAAAAAHLASVQARVDHAKQRVAATEEASDAVKEA